MKFQQNNLNKLKYCMRKMELEEWRPRMSARSFVNSVFCSENFSDLKSEIRVAIFDDKRASRIDVRNFINRKDEKNLEKVLFVLAWGGMNTRNAKLALDSYRRCSETIVNDMLSENVCRDEAYKQFHCLLKNGKLKGMGPAYFTKLIYFLEPNHNGYIMDQWTARSMNLLRKSGDCEIHLLSTGWRNNRRFKNFRVHPKRNDSAVYRAFCEDLECLAESICNTPEETEKLIFSKGGRLENMGCWRRYVLEKTS